MTKLKNVQGGNVSYRVYAAKIHTMLSTAHRYVMAFVELDNAPVGAREPLENLRWEFLHCRTLQDNHNLQPHLYKPRRFHPLMKKIQRVAQSERGYTYSVEGYPLIVTLLPRLKGQGEYQPTGAIAPALETYNTIVSWSQ